MLRKTVGDCPLNAGQQKSVRVLDGVMPDSWMRFVEGLRTDGYWSCWEGFLKQSIMEDLVLWTPEKGKPQGAVISPLPVYLYLHPVV